MRYIQSAAWSGTNAVIRVLHTMTLNTVHMNVGPEKPLANYSTLVKEREEKRA
jgi:hypothetical protein